MKLKDHYTDLPFVGPLALSLPNPFISAFGLDKEKREGQPRVRRFVVGTVDDNPPCGFRRWERK